MSAWSWKRGMIGMNFHENDEQRNENRGDEKWREQWRVAKHGLSDYQKWFAIRISQHATT